MHLSLISTLLLLSAHCHSFESSRAADATRRADTHKEEEFHYKDGLSSQKNEVYYRRVRPQTKNFRHDMPQVRVPTNVKTSQAKLNRNSVTVLKAMLKAREIQEEARYQRRKLHSGTPASSRRNGSSGPTVHRRSGDSRYVNVDLSSSEKGKPIMVYLVNPVESRIPAPGKYISVDDLHTYLWQRAAHLRNINADSEEADNDYNSQQEISNAPHSDEHDDKHDDDDEHGEENDNDHEGEVNAEDVGEGRGAAEETEVMNTPEGTQSTSEGPVGTTTTGGSDPEP